MLASNYSCNSLHTKVGKKEILILRTLKSFVQKCFNAYEQGLFISFCCAPEVWIRCLWRASCYKGDGFLYCLSCLWNTFYVRKRWLPKLETQNNAVVSFGQRQGLCGQLKACSKAICDPLHTILMLMWEWVSWAPSAVPEVPALGIQNWFALLMLGHPEPQWCIC